MAKSANIPSGAIIESHLQPHLRAKRRGMSVSFQVGFNSPPDTTDGEFSLQYFEESQNTTSPHDTIPLNIFSAIGDPDDIDVVFCPKGEGAFQIDTEGDKRGAGAVDLQRHRTDPSQVASGYRAFVGAGYGNTASGDYSATVGGVGNVAGGESSATLGGQSNFIDPDSTNCSTSGGYNNVIGAGCSSVSVAGSINCYLEYANTGFSGGSDTVQAFDGARRFAAISSRNVLFKQRHQTAVSCEDAQIEHTGAIQMGIMGKGHGIMLHAGCETTDATPTQMGLRGSYNSNYYDNFWLPNNTDSVANTAWCFDGLVCCSAQTGHNVQGAWRIEGMAYRTGSTEADVVLDGITVTPVGTPSSGLDCMVIIDTTVGGFVLECTGDADVTVNWAATVRVIQVKQPHSTIT